MNGLDLIFKVFRFWKNVRPEFVKFLQTMRFRKIIYLGTAPHSKSVQTATPIVFDINGKMDLPYMIFRRMVKSQIALT